MIVAAVDKLLDPIATSHVEDPALLRLQRKRGAVKLLAGAGYTDAFVDEPWVHRIQPPSVQASRPERIRFDNGLEDDEP